MPPLSGPGQWYCPCADGVGNLHPASRRVPEGPTSDATEALSPAVSLPKMPTLATRQDFAPEKGARLAPRDHDPCGPRAVREDARLSVVLNSLACGRLLRQEIVQRLAVPSH